MKVFNSLSLNYLPSGVSLINQGKQFSLRDFWAFVAERSIIVESFVGHADTAAIIGVEMNRSSCGILADGEIFAVAQYTGPRLPEGTKTLPAGAEIVVHIFEVKA